MRKPELRARTWVTNQDQNMIFKIWLTSVLIHKGNYKDRNLAARMGYIN